MFTVRDSSLFLALVLALTYLSINHTAKMTKHATLTDQLYEVNFTSGSTAGAQAPKSFNQKANAFLRESHAFLFGTAHN